MPLGPLAVSLILASGCILDSGPITELVTTGLWEDELGPPYNADAGGAAKGETCRFAARRHPRTVRRIPVEMRAASFAYRYPFGELSCDLDRGEMTCPPVSLARTDLRPEGLDAVVVQTLGKTGRRLRADLLAGHYAIQYRCLGPDCSAEKLSATAFSGLGEEPCVVRGGFRSELVAVTYDTGEDDSAADDTGADDTGCGGVDADGDGVACDRDCDDADAGRYPGNAEVCDDGIDQDCDDRDAVCDSGGGDDTGGRDTATGCTGEDADGDHYDCFEDCDDTDSDVHPGAREVACDGVDQDCDGVDDCDTGGPDSGSAGGPPPPRATRHATQRALSSLRAKLRRP